MDHDTLFFGLVLIMEETIFNVALGKYSFKTTKLPFPNEQFIFTKSKEATLNNATGNKDWWKSFLYQLSYGKICFGINQYQKEILESIGLIVKTIDSETYYSEAKRKQNLIKLNKATNNFTKHRNPSYVRQILDNKSAAHKQFDKYFSYQLQMLSNDKKDKFVEFIADITIQKKEIIGMEFKKNKEDLKKTKFFVIELLKNV